MSLSDPKQSNPVKKFIKWSGSRCAFEYYDKEAKERVEVPTPIYIIALDQRSLITGFDEANESGIYSNEVLDLTKEKLVVKSNKGGVIAEGLYQDIKGDKRFNYTKSVYACLVNPNDKALELVNFKFHGSSIGPWIDAKVGDGGEVVVLDKNPEKQKRGATVYYIPTVKKTERREDVLQDVIDIDKDLQKYLNGRSIDVVEESEEKKDEPVVEKPVVEKDDLPF